MPGRDICIPDWYANAENELGLRTGLPSVEMNEKSSLMNSSVSDLNLDHHFLFIHYMYNICQQHLLIIFSLYY